MGRTKSYVKRERRVAAGLLAHPAQLHIISGST
jgi:hypothetical protein